MATLALSVTAAASVVIAGAAVVVAVEVRADEPVAAASSTTDSSTIPAALQALAADRGAEAAPVTDPAAPAGPGDPAAPVPANPAAPGPLPAEGLAPGAAAPAVPGVTAPDADTGQGAPAAQSIPAPTASELTSVLHSAVDPSHSPAQRQSHVERGDEAGAVLDQISTRAGTMMAVVHPQVIDPVSVDGATASGRLQVTFAGSAGPETPLRLSFTYVDGGWKLSARSVCDVASFNGFSCPPGYAR
ncbi:hypothetical protein [Rhodococcus sp. HNM0569]|uniref:hypothetical protein n=1 Tax=Rhodococcus sp. HNM0569 TaxID=2716340 RepID=UPI00146AEE92|nr:hypothetical protein [Rhodococcus sp. HNM0569]NLU84820.1 hypothetical protein [Rhodococcus sp. HNM0569]